MTSSKTAQWPTDGWSVSAPEKQGIDSNQLDKASRRILENYPNVYSLLVVRNGFLVYEKYYAGADKNSAYEVFSITKSVMSALTGIAIREKLIEDTEQKVSELIPSYFNSIDDENKKNITVESVLTMRGGLDAVDSNYRGYYSSPDWVTYALNKPMTTKLNEEFVYNTGLPHFLSRIIFEKSEMSTKDFAQKYLFEPLNMRVDNWDADRAGCHGGGSGLYLTPTDMAKFGYLYLNHGKWDGQQVIPEEWVSESTAHKVTTSPELDYGYLFWLQDMENKSNGQIYATYRADGAGGQQIVVIPKIDTVIVVTANLYSSSVDKSDTQSLIKDYVLPAFN